MAGTAEFFIFAMSECGSDDDGPVEIQVSTFQAPTAETVPMDNFPAPNSSGDAFSGPDHRRPAAPTRSPTPVFTRPTVTIGVGTFGAEIADTPADRVQELSDRDELAPRTSMLLVFESDVASSFWMTGMRFALDFVWISVVCTVTGTTVNVPPPASDSDTSPPNLQFAAPPPLTP